ncbi:MAG: response regulator [Gracilibacteraceae bacterium]|jgi:signal transduction histidine kinase/DNA-binding response OmpR family regulator|nr:response regulator [Gracilibacteraceae bacterium]
MAALREEMAALREENKSLTGANKKLTRLLNHEHTINERNRTAAEAKANLSRIISVEKSKLEQYMNLLLSNCPDLILLFDQEEKLVLASESFLRTIKIPVVALIRGKSYREIFEPVATEEFRLSAGDMLTTALREKGSVERELDLDLSRAGQARHYLIQATPMLDEAGAAEGVMLIFYDTTDITRAQRDAEYARELAEQSTRAKSDFLSRMSHEMRTPMNAIIGMTAIGKASADAQRKEYCLDKINEASQHLLGVINDILDMSKIEANKFELSFSEFNFEKMLQRVTNVINFRMDEKKQTFLIDLDKEIPAGIVSDEQRLIQVLTNLLSNAVKFTPRQGVISLSARKLAETDGGLCTLRIEVRDNGIGISPEQQDRLFTSFEQADGSISRKFGGTGLGLAISKRIVEMMGGKIWIESELNQGAAFIFEINAQKGKKPPPDIVAPAFDWHNLNIMAVDDMPEILELFQSILSPYGARVVTAASGEEALVRIEEKPERFFDLIFIDWRMPGMNGVDLSRAIQGRDGARPIVIMISAVDWAEIEQEARSAGVVHFLQKPLFPSMLVDCINECMSGQEKKIREEAGDTSDDGILAGKRILLAEDVEINREIVSALMEYTGVDIDFAFNGEEAVAKFSADPEGYDLILMDVHMPNMDGYEATRRIRASGEKRAGAIPIIAMTANVFREDIERCLAAGMNAHLGKPINAAEVITELKRHLL